MTAETYARLRNKFLVGDGCWEWTGVNRQKQFYGSWWDGTRKVMAHRAVYELMVGPIPPGLMLDHLCRNPRCVRPDHLEPVDNRTNLLRGVNPAAVNAVKTHCIHGHEFDETNTYRDAKGKRLCRICRRDAHRRRRAARAALTSEQAEGRA